VKFGDVVTAVATLAVIMILIHFPLMIVLDMALGYYWGMNVSAIVSVLLSALIGGYIFAGKIWEESGIGAIAKITVLAALLMAFAVIMETAAMTDWTAWVKEEYTGTAPSSAFEWYAVEGMFLGYQVFLNVVIVLALGFVGLYIGSMFKRPAKT
jgi:hypothetical protein